MKQNRRDWLKMTMAGLAGMRLAAAAEAAPQRELSPLVIKDLRITPIALPDPPLLFSGGLHGPYFLRNIVELETDAGIVGIGETRGGQKTTEALEKARPLVVGKNAFSHRSFAAALTALNPSVFAGIELACLDACGQATGRSLSELLGGPVRTEIEFAAYLFYRYAADHPKVLADTRVVDGRDRGDKALDTWGEVRTTAAMVQMAAEFQKRWGFRVLKLKAGILPPDTELETMQALNDRFQGKCPLRIDPNGLWKPETAVRIGKKLRELRLEYYEDPVVGQAAMAVVRQETGLPMSTNMCVTRFEHIPEAVKIHPIDVVLGDHHSWGGLVACQELGRICQTFGWGLSQHSNNHAGITMAAMIHFGAVVPQLAFASDTHYPWLTEGVDVIQGPNLPIRDGKMKVPTGPGIGVRLDRDRLARAHEVYQKCGIRERDDVFTMRLVEPGWERKPF